MVQGHPHRDPSSDRLTFDMHFLDICRIHEIQQMCGVCWQRIIAERFVTGIPVPHQVHSQYSEFLTQSYDVPGPCLHMAASAMNQYQRFSGARFRDPSTVFLALIVPDFGPHQINPDR